MDLGVKSKFILSFFFVFAGIIFFKSFYLQVVHRKKILDYSKNQFQRKIITHAVRGNIKDRSGRSMAINKTSYDLIVMPQHLVDRKNTFLALAKLSDKISFEMLHQKTQGRNRYTPILRGIDLDKKTRETIKKMPGIFLEENNKRIYPNDNLAAQVLGFIGVDKKGLEGIEYVYDDYLRGTPEVLLYNKDARGKTVEYLAREKAQAGRDLTLTVDLKIQSFMEKQLALVHEKHEADKVGAAIIDAKTGEIFAIANYPTYNPNQFSKFPSTSRKLSFITDPIEAGSVVKVATVAAAFQDNLVDENSEFFCERGSYQIDDQIITEAESHEKFPWLSVEEILVKSSNIGTTKLAFELGEKKLLKHWKEFGFFSKTGIEMPGESKGIYRSSRYSTLHRISNMSFGQSIAITPLQLMSFYTMLVNDGVYHPPTLIKEGYRPGKKILRPEVAKRLQEILYQAVERGTGEKAKIKGFKIAGKTGTAQRPVKGVYEGYISSFIGFPLNTKNKFVVYLYVENPKKNGFYGGQVAAPIVRELIHYLLYTHKEYQNL